MKVKARVLRGYISDDVSAAGPTLNRSKILSIRQPPRLVRPVSLRFFLSLSYVVYISHQFVQQSLRALHCVADVARGEIHSWHCCAGLSAHNLGSASSPESRTSGELYGFVFWIRMVTWLHFPRQCTRVC